MTEKGKNILRFCSKKEIHDFMLYIKLPFISDISCRALLHSHGLDFYADKLFKDLYQCLLQFYRFSTVHVRFAFFFGCAVRMVGIIAAARRVRVVVLLRKMTRAVCVVLSNQSCLLQKTVHHSNCNMCTQKLLRFLLLFVCFVFVLYGLSLFSSGGARHTTILQEGTVIRTHGGPKNPYK